MTEQGTIYICATPIGNLEDVTYRLLRILKEVDLIAAEDTRQTRKLLSYYDIHTPLTSYHQHNERGKAEYLVEQVLAGKNLAVVSDAGIPGISDPGFVITQKAVEAGVTIIPIPGPSAALTALVTSGLPSDRFVFEGFLDSHKKHRRERLQELRRETRTLIFYEAPHRLLATLKDLLENWGDRPAVVARELTKKHEEFVRGTLSSSIDWFNSREPRGEIVLIVGGNENPEASDDVEVLRDPVGFVETLVSQGLDKKEAIKQVAKALNLPKREVYEQVHNLKGLESD